jgi:hypothetical protein
MLLRSRIICLLAAALLAAAQMIDAAALAAAQEKGDPADLLAAAAQKGKQLAEALRGYSYYAELTLQTVSPADVITGKYFRFSQLSYDRDGNRQERVFENTSTLPKEAHIGTNAAYNLIRVYQFTITPEALNQYEFNYVGREKIDELNTYVFDVKPKVKMPDPEKSAERFLKGRVWVDDQDLQVVKVAGQALPEQGAHRTPKFETYFQNYDQYWFPAYTSADDEMRVGNRLSRVIVKVRFTSYKKVGN